jgi:hypothetical protein
MPRKGHTEEQIIYALRQAEAGKKVGDICREMGFRRRPSTVGSGDTPVWV